MIGGERSAWGLLSLYPKMLGFSVVYVHKYIYIQEKLMSWEGIEGPSA